MTLKPHCPNDCYQGSTEFYDTPETDEFTPSYANALPLVDNVGRRKDGTIPPWMEDEEGADAERRRHLTPSERYVEWFNGLWHTGDPDTWNATVFTNDSVMIDPTGISRGAKQAANNFILLFKYYPELRGEVVSWAANDREIFINWRFRIVRDDKQSAFMVPVTDKFCFSDGRVSFRLAYFDLATLSGYLAELFGQDHLLDYLIASLRNAESTGGIESLPSILWSLTKGLFRWFPATTTSGLNAISKPGGVSLAWPASPGATYYRIARATALSGPYTAVGGKITPKETGDKALQYEDMDVEVGEMYWYTVTPFFGDWKPVPVRRIPPTNRPHRLQQRIWN